MEVSHVIYQHILTTVMVFLIGFLIGGGLGILLAWLFRLLYKAVPSLRPPLMVFPWRTVLFALVLFFGSAMPSIVAASQRLKPNAAVYPAMAFLLLVIFFVAEAGLNQWLPTGPAVRWLGVARTFAVTCGVIVALGANAAGSGILYYAQIITSQTFKLDGYWTALGVVMGLGLIFDLVIGIFQMFLAQAERRKTANWTASAGVK
jgi:ABC-type nitrate/sulfonate/bicarbonate transport system permease component